MIFSEEVGANQKPVYSSSYVIMSNSFIAPSESTILWFDVRKTPERNQVLQPFTKAIPDLSSTSAFFRGDSNIEVPCYEAREK